MKSKIKPHSIDSEMFPPFNGFPEEGLKFLKQLKKNNNRPWFGENKHRYEEFLKEPMQSLIATLKPPMADLAPEIEVNPKKVFRIYRDTRFSKNKTPYKTNIAAVFNIRTGPTESAGFYLSIEPGEVYIGGGIYMPPSPLLKKLRYSIATNSHEFLSIVGSDSFHKKLGKVEGEKLARMPIGFPANHMMGEWLKHKWMFAGVTLPEDVCHSPKFAKKVMEVFAEVHPFVRFINDSIAG